MWGAVSETDETLAFHGMCCIVGRPCGLYVVSVCGQKAGKPDALYTEEQLYLAL